LKQRSSSAFLFYFALWIFFSKLRRERDERLGQRKDERLRDTEK